MNQQASVVGSIPFREISGEEEALIVAHDIEQAFIDMLATGEFRERVIDWLTKTGRFGTGACFPVVFMKGVIQFKVYASVESARSNEKMPPPFTVSIEGETGERKPDTELITEATVDVSRVTGVDVNTAVDKARIEAGIVPLVPVRTADGAIKNGPGKHAQRSEDYQQRFAKSKQTVIDKKAAAEAATQTGEERLRAAAEAEARQQIEQQESGANLK